MRDDVDRPIYWFVILDLALARGDFYAAAEAKEELRRLGIDIRLHLDLDSCKDGACRD